MNFRIPCVSLRQRTSGWGYPRLRTRLVVKWVLVLNIMWIFFFLGSLSYSGSSLFWACLFWRQLVSYSQSFCLNYRNKPPYLVSFLYVTFIELCCWSHMPRFTCVKAKIQWLLCSCPLVSSSIACAPDVTHCFLTPSKFAPRLSFHLFWAFHGSGLLHCVGSCVKTEVLE